MELLVVVSILSVISLAVYSSMAGGVNIWKRVNATAGESRLILVWEKMQKDLRNTFDFRKIGFGGNGNEIYFPGLVSVKGEDEAIHQEIGRVRYYFDKSRLCREEMTYVDLIKDVKIECGEEISDVKQAAFEYYGSKKYSWQTEWQNDSVPLAVRFNVILPDTNEEKFTMLLP